MPDSDQGHSADYRAIKRIRQACVNCRRKKVRCSGDRPVCAFCHRLSQSCCYSDETPARQVDPPTFSKPTQDDLFSKVSALEAQLKALTKAMNESKANPPEPRSFAVQHVQPSSTQMDPFQELFPTPQSTTSALGKFSTAPPPLILASLVDDYFLYCHNEPYALFHEPTFRQRLKRGEIPEYLLLVFLASAVRYSTQPFFQGVQMEAIKEYSDRSWALVVKRWHGIDEETDLDVIRAILLHSVIDFTSGKRHHAWIKIGITIRVSQDLGLMYEPNVSLDPVEKEERRRIFWSTYLLDKFVSCNRTRPSGIRDDDCTVQLPCHDSAFEARQDVICPTLIQIDTSIVSDPSPFALAASMSSLLAKAAKYALSSTIKVPQVAPWDPTSEFASISSKLASYESRFRLGDPVHPAVIFGNNAANQPIGNRSPGYLVLANVLWHVCQCLINHPLLILQRPNVVDGKSHGRRNFLRRAFESSTEHTVALSELLRDTQAAGCTIRTSIYAYCTMVSSTIHILNLHSSNECQRLKAVELLECNRTLLEKLSLDWRSARMMLVSLRDFEADSFRYSNLLDSETHSNLERIDVSGLDELLDYNSLSTKVLDLKPSGEDPASWMYFDHTNFDLLSYPTPSENLSSSARSAEGTMPLPGEMRFDSSSSPAAIEMSPLSLFLIGQGNT